MRWMMILLPLVAACSPHVVEPGTVGVKASWGAVDDTSHHEGLYWRSWFKDQFVNMDARVQKKEAACKASSRDLQVVTTLIALNWRIQPDEAPLIYQEIGDIGAIEKTVIEPVLQEAVKTATARYNAEELITKRPEVKRGIHEYVEATLGQSHLVVLDLSIVNFEFDKQYQDAIEAKQVAEQRALTATNDLRRIEVEAKQSEAKAQGVANSRLIAARAESERQELLRKTLSPELLQWEAIQKWDGRTPVVAGEDAATVVDLSVLGAAAKR